MAVTALENPKAPHNQQFNVGARRNKTKVNSWWNVSSSTYWRNKRKAAVQKNQED